MQSTCKAHAWKLIQSTPVQLYRGLQPFCPGCTADIR
jgi:hypothetical protein